MPRIDMSEHLKDQLLDALMYRVSLEQRGHLIREVPAAYNAYCQREIALVVHSSDGRAA